MAEDDGVALRIERTLRSAVSRYGTAFVTVTLAAFPAAYTLKPDLATSPGFWRDARGPLFVLWALLLFLAIAKLTGSQDQRSDEQHALMQAMDARLAATGRAQSEVRGLIDGLLEVVQETRLGLSDVGDLVRARSTQEQIAYAVAAASQSRGGLDDLPPLPEDAALCVVLGPRDGEFEVLYPAELAAAGADQAVQSISNVFGLGRQDLPGKAFVVRVEEQHRERLPLRLRFTRIGIVAPLYDPRARRVGTIVVCSGADLLLDRQLRQGLQKRVVNVAEEIAPIVCSWRWPSSGEVVREA